MSNDSDRGFTAMIVLVVVVMICAFGSIFLMAIKNPSTDVTGTVTNAYTNGSGGLGVSFTYIISANGQTYKAIDSCNNVKVGDTVTIWQSYIPTQSYHLNTC